MAEVNHPINSSAIEDMWSDADAQTLRVRFHSGGETTFNGVSQEVVTELLNAPSAGRYFNQSIRGQFEEA